LLFDAAGRETSYVLDGDDALKALLVEAFGRLTNHPRAKANTFMLQEIEKAVTVQAILKRFPDMSVHIERMAQRAKEIRARDGHAKRMPRGDA